MIIGRQCTVYMSEIYKPIHGRIVEFTETFVVIDDKVIPWTNILFIDLNNKKNRAIV